MTMDAVESIQAQCIASTYTEAASEGPHPPTNKSFLKSAQWSPDGTCLLTHGEDNKLRTFVLPPDLLSSRADPLPLTPYTTHTLPEPSYAVKPFPHFDLSNPSTTLILTSPRDHPLRLTNVLDPSPTPTPLATYPLITTHTETYITPHALHISRDGHHIVAGGPSLLASFDIERPNDPPQHWLPTIPSRRSTRVGGGVGMKGLVSALAESPTDKVLAAGTFSRWIGIYDNVGRGDARAVFRLPPDGVDGAGITSLEWTACGRYLLVAERRSTCMLLYDVRVVGKLLARLSGRAADTNQRMGVALVPGAEGSDVYAGGTDGVVRAWRGVTAQEGDVVHAAEWLAHSDAVASTALYPSPALRLVATCAGQRHFEDVDVDGVAHVHKDVSLKVWNLQG